MTQLILNSFSDWIFRHIWKFRNVSLRITFAFFTCSIIYIYLGRQVLSNRICEHFNIFNFTCCLNETECLYFYFSFRASCYLCTCKWKPQNGGFVRSSIYWTINCLTVFNVAKTFSWEVWNFRQWNYNQMIERILNSKNLFEDKYLSNKLLKNSKKTSGVRCVIYLQMCENDFLRQIKKFHTY